MAPERNDGFYWAQAPWGQILRCGALDPYAHHMFTTRSPDPQSRQCGATDTQITGELGASHGRVIRLRQVHGRHVIDAREAAVTDYNSARTAADGVVSTDAKTVLAVRVADCVPLLIGDRRKRAVAAVHGGWRGMAAAIARAAVETLEQSGAPAEDLVAAVGPSIGPCCYQVGQDVRDAFTAQHGPRSARWFAPDGAEKWKLDMWAATRDQLIDAGVPPAQVHVARLCTACDSQRFYSYRREGTATGRLEGVIRLAD